MAVYGTLCPAFLGDEFSLAGVIGIVPRHCRNGLCHLDPDEPLCALCRSPLLIIMVVAILWAKLPLFYTKGLWTMLNESRIDVIMILLLLYLLKTHEQRVTLPIRTIYGNMINKREENISERYNNEHLNRGVVEMDLAFQPGDVVQAEYKSGIYVGEVVEVKAERRKALIKVLAVLKHPDQGDLHHPGQADVPLFSSAQSAGVPGKGERAPQTPFPV